ncbi:riboflavin synthase [bacterium]|nr:riboflavin synthase [bacterium]
MFTGLVEEVGRVERASPRGTGMFVSVETKFAGELRVGDSVAVDGYCLTVTDVGIGRFFVDIGQETLKRTTAAKLRTGSRVNLERAVRLGDRLGGHLVTGHIDGLGAVESIEKAPDFIAIRVRVPEAVARYLIPKGSIAINGVSLTVNEVEGAVFSVGIIPHTAANTTLGDLANGDAVNLEADLIGKYVERLLGAATGKDPDAHLLDLLKKQGFA